jgi:hypothetical protein
MAIDKAEVLAEIQKIQDMIVDLETLLTENDDCHADELNDINALLDASQSLMRHIQNRDAL